MNRIYQVIWSSVKDCYVVVSENAGRHGKKKAVHLAPSTTKRTMLAMSLGAAVLFGSAASASAATGNKVIGGSQDAVTDAKGNTDQAVATGDYSTISGGYLNHAEGNYSSVSGGSDNQAFGEDSSVSGGGQNKATGKGASVAGGLQNQAGGEFSTVSGGSGNKAFGWGSIVIGGTGNVAGKVAVDDNGNYLTDANGNQYPANQGLIGQVSVAIGGVSSSVQGNSSVGIAGGSTSAKAASGLAAGKQATVTMANGVAIGYESTASVIDASRTADTEGRIVSFGHQAGDVYYTVDHQNHTVTENQYDSAAYNRLVNVADGIDDHDVVVMEQLKALASQGMNFSASNKVDGAYKTVKKNLGDTVAVRANDAQDGHTYKTDNLTTEIDDNGIITVKMDTKLTADKVTVGKDGNAITLDGSNGNVTTGSSTLGGAGLTIANGPSVTTGGISGGSKQITEVKSGASSMDDSNNPIYGTDTNAANIGDVKKIAAKTVTVSGDGKNTTVAKTPNADGTVDYKVSLNDSVTLGSDAGKRIALDGTSGTISAGDKVSLNGATGTATIGNAHLGNDGSNTYLTGLTNTTWNGTAVSGRAATEDQLQTVSNTVNAGWKAQIDGTDVKTVTPTNNTLNFVAGDNISLSSGNDIKDIKIATTPDVNFTTVRVGGTKGTGTDTYTGGIYIGSQLGGGANSGTGFYITGLQNTNWNANSIVSGRAATEDQLKTVSDTVNAGWELDVNGTKQKAVTPTSPKVNFVQGQNITISGSGDNVTVATEDDVRFASVRVG
ncbi:MAG: hypothetical protein MR947_02970 [Mitsuokella jalaludinii]|nr:hypothetical protein [Mitsuokella jalaludinii]